MKLKRIFLYVFPAVLVTSTVMIHILEFWMAEHPDEQYGSLFNSFYWTIVTISTVGFGDMSPKTPEGRFFTLFVIGSGVVLYSLLVSTITSKLTEFRSNKELGLSQIKASGHVLVCSDQPSWILEITRHLQRKKFGREVVIISPSQLHPLVTSEYNTVPWVAGDAYRMEALIKASAQKATIAYVCFKDNNHSLMTVQQLETLTQGVIVTLAQYIGRDFRNYFADVGCDYAVDPYDLCVPMMMQAYRSQGGPSWIRGVVHNTQGHQLLTVDLKSSEVGMTWLHYVEKVKEQTGAMPLGVVSGEIVVINPACEHILHHENKVIQLRSPLGGGDRDEQGMDVLGMDDIRIDGHLLICSDNPVFIDRMLFEMSHCELEDHIVVLSNLTPSEQLPENLSLEWIKGSSNSEEAFKKGRAALAKVAFVDHLQDGQTLISVLRLEQETDGDIFTIATYREDDFDLHLLRVGCDFCLKYDDLVIPMLTQSSSNAGLSNLITQVLSQELSTQSLFVRRLSYHWEECDWMETIRNVKTETDQLPVGLIRRGNNQLIINPNPELMVYSGDRLVFLTREYNLRQQELFETHPEDKLSIGESEHEGEKARRLEKLLGDASTHFQQENYLGAFHALLEAANRGSEEAKYQLGIMHFKGRGVTKNLEEAHYWFREAALGGHEPARSVLSTIRVLRDAEQRLEEESREIPNFDPQLLAQLNSEQRAWFARMVVAMIQADGRIDLHERSFLHSAIQLIAESKGVQELEEAVLLGHPLPLYHVEIKEELKHKLMESLLNVATIDHDFDETEESLLREIGKTIGFEDQLLAQLVELGHSRAQQFHSTQLHAPNARARV